MHTILAFLSAIELNRWLGWLLLECMRALLTCSSYQNLGFPLCCKSLFRTSFRVVTSLYFVPFYPVSSVSDSLGKKKKMNRLLIAHLQLALWDW